MRRKITTPWGTTIPSSLTDDKMQMTAWNHSSRFDSMRCHCAVRRRGGTGSILISSAFQTTSGVRSPGTPTQNEPSGDDQNGHANGTGSFGTDSSLTSLADDDKRFTRFGWIVKADTGDGHATEAGP